MTLPIHINTPALKKPCTYKYKITNSFICVKHKTIKKPQWLMVEYANIFFTSDWNAALTPPYAAVQEPTTTNKYLLKTEYSNKWLKRKTKKTPAETKVAEWINDDAGTGASIESGNQICTPNCADLTKAAPRIVKHKNSI